MYAVSNCGSTEWLLYVRSFGLLASLLHPLKTKRIARNRVHCNDRWKRIVKADHLMKLYCNCGIYAITPVSIIMSFDNEYQCRPFLYTKFTRGSWDTAFHYDLWYTSRLSRMFAFYSILHLKSLIITSTAASHPWCRPTLFSYLDTSSMSSVNWQ